MWFFVFDFEFQALSQSDLNSASRPVRVLALMLDDMCLWTAGAICGVIAPTSKLLVWCGFASKNFCILSTTVVREATGRNADELSCVMVVHWRCDLLC